MKIKAIYFTRLRPRFGDFEDLDIRDMLRYDTAFQSKVDPTLIAFPVFQTPQGDLGGGATAGRWDSFATRLEDLRDEREIADLKFGRDDSQWITYRHVGNNCRDLVPFTLAQYREAKDLRALDAAHEKKVMEELLYGPHR